MRDVVYERLERLRALRDDAPGDVALAGLMSRFTGYRIPDLSEGAWERLSRSDLAGSVDPELLAEAFYIYRWNRQFEELEDEINRLVYSELFYLPERRATAIAISERIMEQRLSWADQLLPQYESFLSHAAR